MKNVIGQKAILDVSDFHLHGDSVIVRSLLERREETQDSSLNNEWYTVLPGGTKKKFCLWVYAVELPCFEAVYLHDADTGKGGALVQLMSSCPAQ